MTSKTHVRRIFTLLAVAAVVGLFAQWLLKPKSFGDLGYFRADSLKELLNVEPVYQGVAACADCHSAIHQAHEKDIHFRVPCEDCHGPGAVHVRFHQGKDTLITRDQAVMPRQYTLEGCLFCHRKLAARPRNFAQIDPAEHYRFLHVVDPDTKCVECHSPHEPLFVLEEVSKARVHPVIQECENCHEGQPERDSRDVPHHPVVFVCRDCHPAVVKDFMKHEHAFLRCTACHSVYREGETLQRIVKNGNRRFCLLCHEAKPFKDKAGMPQIVYAEHLETMAKAMRKDPAALEEEPTMCLTCHLDFIHDRKLIRTLQEHKQ